VLRKSAGASKKPPFLECIDDCVPVTSVMDTDITRSVFVSSRRRHVDELSGRYALRRTQHRRELDGGGNVSGSRLHAWNPRLQSDLVECSAACLVRSGLS
jgi:hypothetical protein